MSLFTFNHTHANVIAERDAALAKVKVIRKLADERKAELTKSQKALETLNKKYDWLNTEHEKVRQAKVKAKRSAGEWTRIACEALYEVTAYSSELTGNTIDTSAVKKEAFKQRFASSMDLISGTYNTMVKKHDNKVGDYNTMVAKYEYKVGEFHTEREAKEKAKADLAKESEAKRSLEARLKRRDEEITRLKAEVASVNTRFDALTSLATENIVSRFSGMVNGNNKRPRITNELD
tara:strand:- start:142 stop:846 length:705 start_codon:yes stop_codon:yes gene_type:complete